MGLRVTPSKEEGCGANKGVYLFLEALPEFGSRAWCHPLVSPPPSSGASAVRARLFCGNASPEELRKGPSAPSRDGSGALSHRDDGWRLKCLRSRLRLPGRLILLYLVYSVKLSNSRALELRLLKTGG